VRESTGGSVEKGELSGKRPGGSRWAGPIQGWQGPPGRVERTCYMAEAPRSSQV